MSDTLPRRVNGHFVSVLQKMTFLAVALVLVVACGPGDSPEEQVRIFVEAGEEAVESRKISSVKKLISDQYKDPAMRTKRDIVVLMARYLYMNKNIHLLTRIDQLNFPQPDIARFHLYVAMTGQNVSDLDSLLNMQADLYRFDIELVLEEKEWKLYNADWRPAKSTDFF